MKYSLCPTNQVKAVIVAALKERLESFIDGTENWGDQKHQTLDALVWMQQLPTCQPTTKPLKKRKGVAK